MIERIPGALLLLALFAACVPAIPAQVADIVVTEKLTQRFLVADKRDPEKADTYYSLVGKDASKVLAAVDPRAVTDAQRGELLASGELLLAARLNPYDKKSYWVEGRGTLGVFRGERLLITVELDVGSADVHDVNGLRSLQVVLPIRHRARLNPALLLVAAKKNSDGDCVLADTEVSCMAAGVGSPFVADYYVKVHLKEIVAGKVYGLDRERGHEVFRNVPGGHQVFGCVTFDKTGGPLRILDLRSNDLVKELPNDRRHSPAPAEYDGWKVDDACAGGEPALAGVR